MEMRYKNEFERIYEEGKFVGEVNQTDEVIYLIGMFRCGQKVSQ
jgi:hypothetical protein